MQRLVIVGGGFAGVTLAQHLERGVPADLDVVVVSGENHLVFSPLLAEAAGRSVSPGHMVVAGRQMLKRARWLTARVSDIELSDNVLHYQTPGGKRGSLAYDHLGFGITALLALQAWLGSGPSHTGREPAAAWNRKKARPRRTARLDAQAICRFLSNLLKIRQPSADHSTILPSSVFPRRP